MIFFYLCFLFSFHLTLHYFSSNLLYPYIISSNLLYPYIIAHPPPIFRFEPRVRPRRLKNPSSAPRSLLESDFPGKVVLVAQGLGAIWGISRELDFLCGNFPTGVAHTVAFLSILCGNHLNIVYQLCVFLL